MHPQVDKGTEKLFKLIADQLQPRYSAAEADQLIAEYCSKFTNPEYCEAIGVPVQDEDFFHHEGSEGMALRIHYYLRLGLDPNPIAFIRWRSEFLKRA